MFDSRKIFSGKEKNYDKNRPAYPTQLSGRLCRRTSIYIDEKCSADLYIRRIYVVPIRQN